MTDLASKLRQQYHLADVGPEHILRRAADELERLAAERDALEADARRYRWLRAGVVGVSAGVDEDGHVIYHARCRRLTQMLRVPSASPTNAEIDAAIDRTAGRLE
jgi:hypothetical protein